MPQIGVSFFLSTSRLYAVEWSTGRTALNWTWIIEWKDLEKLWIFLGLLAQDPCIMWLCWFNVTHTLSLSVLTSIYPGEPGLASFIRAKDDGSGGDNWSCKTCEAPVAKRTVSKHWREGWLSVTVERVYSLLLIRTLFAVVHVTPDGGTVEKWVLGSRGIFHDRRLSVSLRVWRWKYSGW